MNITPINNKKQDIFGLRIVKRRGTAQILKEWFPKKLTYNKIEYDFFEVGDVNGRNIIVYVNPLKGKNISLSARGQSVDVSYSKKGRKNKFSKKVKTLIEKINDKILS